MSQKTSQKTYDFGDGNGPVPAHQHKNGGGWVADSVEIEATVYVGPNARIFGTAKVFGGTIRGGTIWGGTIWGGTIWGGTIRGGTIRGGTIWGGTIRGGTIRGGTIRGGTIWGGTIEDGTIEGGTIEDGATIKTNDDFQQGQQSEFVWTLAKNGEGAWMLRFGCERHPLKEWSKLHDKLAEKHGMPHMAKVTRAVAAFVSATLKVYSKKTKVESNA